MNSRDVYMSEVKACQLSSHGFFNSLTAAAGCGRQSSQKGSVLESNGSQASSLMQACTLTKRSFLNMSRDMGYYWLRLAIYVVLSLCIGTMYYKVGLDESSIQVHIHPFLLQRCCPSFSLSSHKFADVVS